MSSNNDQNPGLISGHAQYAKGAVVETIGSVTGSEAWRSSGEQDKDAGTQQMKDAGAQRDGSGGGTTMGKAEELAGKAVGCEGMEKEGQQVQQDPNST